MKRTIELKNYGATEGACECGCGKQMGSEIALALQAFITILERVYAAPVRHIVTSGARCKEHNEEVGGSPSSQHIEGRAADGVFQWKSPAGWMTCDFLDLGAIARKSGLFGGIGYLEYQRLGQLFIHLDVRPGQTVVW